MLWNVVFLLFFTFFATSCSESSSSGPDSSEKKYMGELQVDNIAGMVRVHSKGLSTILGTNNPTAKPIEQPQMSVDFTYDYSIGRHEVICKDFNELMANVSGLQVPCPSDSIPVADVTYLDAILYANEVSKKFGRDTVYSYESREIDGGNHCVSLEDLYFESGSSGFRLPTEAEWVMAASFSWYPEKSWNGETSNGVAHKVCSMAQGDELLCDMSGNLLEWVNDWLGEFSNTTYTNYLGAIDGGSLGSCVVKGGSFYTSAKDIELSNRGDTYPVLATSRADYVGFRLAYGVIPRGVRMTNQNGKTFTSVEPLVGVKNVRNLTKSYKAKLAFRNDETHNLTYVFFSSSEPSVVEIQDTIDVYHPEISPDGHHVAFCTSMEGVAGKSSVYVRDFSASGGNLVKLEVENAAIPRWRVDENGDTLIVYVSSAGNNKGETFSTESTWQVPFAGGKFGVPQKLFDGAYHGGVSADGHFAVTGSSLLRAHLKFGNDVVWYAGEQACNASLAKDKSMRTLFLDFGGSLGTAFAGVNYGTHERLLIADSTGNLVHSVAAPSGYTFDHSEWVGGMIGDSLDNYVVVTLANMNGVHQRIALIDLNTDRVVPLVEGGELWHPSLWIQQGFMSSQGTLERKNLVNMDSAGIYYKYNEKNQFNFSSVEVGLKLQSFWKMKDEVEVVSFGSSMLMDAVIDDSIKTMKSLNMCVTMTDIHLHEYLIKNYVLPYGSKVKAVVVELSPGFLYRYKTDMFNYLINYSIGIQYDQKHLSKETVEAIAENSLDMVLPQDYGQSYVKGTLLMPSISWGFPSVVDGVVYAGFEMDILQENLNILRSLKQLSDAYGVKLIAAITPRNPAYRDTDAYCFYGPSRTVAHQIFDAITAMGIPIFDENKDGYHDYSDAMAYNTNHLSYLGAAQFSVRLDAFLATLPW